MEKFNRVKNLGYHALRTRDLYVEYIRHYFGLASNGEYFGEDEPELPKIERFIENRIGPAWTMPMKTDTWGTLPPLREQLVIDVKKICDGNDTNGPIESYYDAAVENWNEIEHWLKWSNLDDPLKESKSITFKQLKRMLKESDDTFYITYNEILDVLEDFEREDIEELAGMEPIDADDWIYKYVDIPGFDGDGYVENIDHIGAAAVEVAMDLIHGKSIAQLRKAYGKDRI